MEIHFSFYKTLPIIPVDLIFDNILPRLPVISLLRFKSVCKSWNSAICTPQFTKSHLHFSSSLSPHFLLLNKDDIYTLAYNNNLKQPVKLEHSWDYYVDVVGCCNGLICLSVFENSDNFFIVWNPATRRHRKIFIPTKYEDSSPLLTHGFGYCPIQGVADYKIVFSLSVQNCFWVFSLRTGLWKSIDYPFHKIKYAGIYVDHTLYWDNFEPDRICICSFSLIDEQFDQKTPLMIPCDEISYGDTLSVFKGCLSFLCQRPAHFDVFVLKKDGDSTSWQKLLSIPLIFNVRFVDFTITGKCLVIHQNHIDESVIEHLHQTSSEGVLPKPWSGELKLVDPTLEGLEHSRGISSQLEYVDSSHHYVESLVSL